MGSSSPEALTAYLQAAAFAGLSIYNAFLVYETRGKAWKMILASVTAVILFVLAWRSWPV